MYYKAFIRVIKSIHYETSEGFSLRDDVIAERLIEADDKAGVKAFLKLEYPQFFPEGKVYEKETKDTKQFFYVVIYPLRQYELDVIAEGKWTCAYCGQVHENKYVSRPRLYAKVTGDLMFCKSEHDMCLQRYMDKKFEGVELRDDFNFVNVNSQNYIYKITEKSTGKCYVGKTRNAPFFRWWNHLSHSTSKFGTYLRSTALSNWTFEVLETLPSNIDESEVFRIESQYIKQFNSIENGYNSVISCKDVLIENEDQQKLF